MFQPSDILVKGIGKVWCIPIILDEPHFNAEILLEDEEISAIVLVRFHKYFNFVEMYGFASRDEILGSSEDLSSVKVSSVQNFEKIFEHLPKECFIKKAA